jgi:hypothetical protein
VGQSQPVLDTGNQDIRSFLALSARIGRDPGLIQASGGNTSCKDGDVLWIKASGKFLAEAEHEAIFLPVDLRGIRDPILTFSRGAWGQFCILGNAADVSHVRHDPPARRIPSRDMSSAARADM